MGRNLADRCTNEVNASMLQSQQEIIENLKPLLPTGIQNKLHTLIPCKKFDLSYDLNCHKLCSDFQEDIVFRFSLGWSSLVHRFLGPVNAQRVLLGLSEPVFQYIPRNEIAGPCGNSMFNFLRNCQTVFQSSYTILHSHQQYIKLPRSLASTPTAPTNPATPDNASQEELMVTLITGLASLTSRTSMGIIVVGGVIWKTVGWKLVSVSLSMYGALYLYERLTWTTRAKERAFKQQFVNYATEKLQMIVSFTSANCSHQVQQEMATTFARLCQQVDITQRHLEEEIARLSKEIDQLEKIQNSSKFLRNKAVQLENELENFTKQFLHSSKEEES